MSIHRRPCTEYQQTGLQSAAIWPITEVSSREQPLLGAADRSKSVSGERAGARNNQHDRNIMRTRSTSTAIAIGHSARGHLTPRAAGVLTVTGTALRVNIPVASRKSTAEGAT